MDKPPEPFHVFCKRPQPPLRMLDEEPVRINWPFVLACGVVFGSIAGMGWLIFHGIGIR